MAANMAQMCSRIFLRNNLVGRNFRTLCFTEKVSLIGRNWSALSFKTNISISRHFSSDSIHKNIGTQRNFGQEETALPKTAKKMLKVAIIGEPNSGKSTLINCLVGEKVVAVTEKPHTTRQLAAGVLTSEETQIVILDTPGIVTQSEGKRLKMTREHVKAPEYALEEADIIGVLCDAANKRTRDRVHEQILIVLEKFMGTPSFLILNKVDKLRHKMDLLLLAAELTEDRGRDEWGYAKTGGWRRFDNVFMISGKTGEGIDDLKDYLMVRANPSDWLYPPEMTTDQELDRRISEIFREQMLELYEHEIPWQVKQVSVLCERREGDKLRIHQKLYCRKKSQKRCVLESIDTLEDRVKQELEKLFDGNIDLTVDVGVSHKVGLDTPLPIY